MKYPDFIPYSKHAITAEDITAVTESLQSEWLIHGPAASEFEDKLSDYLGDIHVITVVNSTAALHLALMAAGIEQGSRVIIPDNAFVDIVQMVHLLGARVCIADVDPGTGLIDSQSVAELLTNNKDNNIKSIVPVHFAGQPADLPTLKGLADEHQAVIIDQAEHALGASYNNNQISYKIGSNPHSDLTVFSFRAGLQITTGDGGAISTSNADWSNKIREWRYHDLQRTGHENRKLAFSSEKIPNPWYYEAGRTGYDFCLSEIQAALGVSQIRHLAARLNKRREIAEKYNDLIADQFWPDAVRPLGIKTPVNSARGLYVIQIDFNKFGVSRAVVMNRLRERGIATQVHFPPLHLQPRLLESADIMNPKYPGCLKYYSQALTLPLYDTLTEEDLYRIIEELSATLKGKPVTATSDRQTDMTTQ